MKKVIKKIKRIWLHILKATRYHIYEYGVIMENGRTYPLGAQGQEFWDRNILPMGTIILRNCRYKKISY